MIQCSIQTCYGIRFIPALTNFSKKIIIFTLIHSYYVCYCYLARIVRHSEMYHRNYKMVKFVKTSDFRQAYFLKYTHFENK